MLLIYWICLYVLHKYHSNMSIRLCNQHQSIAYSILLYNLLRLLLCQYLFIFISPYHTEHVTTLDIFTLMLNVKSNFTDQYLLILTLGLTNNIFLLNVRPCLVELNVQYIWIEEHHHYMAALIHPVL